MTTLGIAIPSHAAHLPQLYKLLQQISASTHLPQQVSVSISSVPEDTQFQFFQTYPFEFIYSATADHLNASQNRNVAAAKLKTDIISFIDSDDISHIKRNEYIMKVFQQGCKAVVHDYHMDRARDDNFWLSNIGDFHYKQDYIDLYNPSILPWPTNSQEHYITYHNAHVSIIRELFDTFKYDENWREVGEDAEYNRRIFQSGIKLSYIANKLSMYVNVNMGK